jgi:hypothetical protein
VRWSWLIALAAVALTGCFHTEEAKVVGTYRDFLDAYGDSDGERACELLTEEAQRELAERNDKETCEDAVSGEERPNFEDGVLAKSRDAVGEDDVELDGERAELETHIITITPIQPSVPPLPGDPRYPQQPGSPPGTPPPPPPQAPDPPDAELVKEDGDWKLASVAFFGE